MYSRAWQQWSVLAFGLFVLLSLSWSDSALGQSAKTSDVPMFDGQKAWSYLIQQCEMGPRTPGSLGNRQLRDFIISQARTGNLHVATYVFETEMPMGESPVELCNIVVSAGPSTRGPDSRLWLGAHFDTRPISDRDSNPEQRDQPLVGANDGASGVAVLLHLMELMIAQPPAFGVDLIFFDGEDSGTGGQASSFCIGSQKLAGTLGDFDNPLEAASCEGLIVLDMIGDADLFVPMEGYSLQNAPVFTKKVFSRAQELGLPAFSMTPGQAVFDDHVPFLQQGIPAVDLIDFDYPLWHTTQDTPAACSAASLEQVGLLVTDLVYNRHTP